MKIQIYKLPVLFLLLSLGLGIATSSDAQDGQLDSLETVSSSEPMESPERLDSKGDIEEQEAVTANELLQVEESRQNTFDPQVIALLNAKQEQLSQALENEDAYSLRLAEVYSEYGALLLNAKRFDEAADVYRQALHIEKVNSGLYAIEQLYVLKPLLDIAIKARDDEKLDTYLSRAVLIKNNHEDIDSEYLDDIFVAAGHYFIDRFYSVRGNFKVKIEQLRSARQFFEYVLARHQDRPFSEYTLPYGELFLVAYLESTIIAGLAYNSQNAIGGNRNNLSPLEEVRFQEARREYSYLSGAYDRGMDYLQNYLVKARRDENSAEIVKSLLATGDMHLLFSEPNNAAQFYKATWNYIEKYDLQADYLTRLANPEIIPSFGYSVDSEGRLGQDETMEIPLSFSLSRGGAISNIKGSVDEEHKRYFARARRALRKLIFRPAIINGELVALEKYTYTVKVAVN